jgi:hypothetical protein
MADLPPGPWVILGSRFVVDGPLPQRLRDPLASLLEGFEGARTLQLPEATVRVQVEGHVHGAGEVTFHEVGRSPERIPVDPLEASAVEYAIIRMAVHLVRHRVVLHAASVEHGAGSTLLLGESGMGKTTLALLLHSAGCTLLSDDLSPLDPLTGAVSAFPRPPRLDGDPPREVHAALPQPPPGFPHHRAPFPGNGAEAPGEGYPVGRILVLDRSGPGEETEALTSAEVVQLLLRSVIRGRSMDFAALIPILAGVARRAPAFRIRSASPQGALEAALRILRA